MHDTTATSRHIASQTTDVDSLGLATAAAAVRNGDITSEAYTAALLQRARALAELNAFITIDEAAVLAAARDADKARAAGSAAPLLGAPLGVKDSYLTKGLPTSLGVEGLAHFVPREDADAVRAIKGAGALVFGKNNLVEMSYGLTGHKRTLRPGEESARTRSRVGRLLERLRRVRGRWARSRVLGR
ncbi:Asp-tRNA(Asn)/Glu-tRNA(Gln) amidotransferase A subunit family amidase [Bradyrhizobium sp. JR3.5]